MRLRFSGRALASLVPVLGLTLTAACHRHDTGGHSHGSAPADAGGHAHEEKTFQITVWAEGYEVFAEHQPVVAGTSTTFITHVTDLNTFEPRIEGSVRFVMRHAEETRDHPQAQPDRAGIYLPDIVFPRPGEWQLSLAIPNNGGEAVVPLGSIYAYGDAHDAAHANVPEAPEGVSFLKEQQWKIQARTEPAAQRRLIEQLRLPATVKARPGGLAKVTPPIPGRLALAPRQPMPLVGQTVAKGQVLALIQPTLSEVGIRFLEAEGEVTRAKLALEQAKLTLERTERLAQQAAKSARELQEAQFAVKTAQARYDAALALQASYKQASSDLEDQEGNSEQPAVELRSPIDGVIVEQSGVAVGEYITGDQPMFTVLDARQVFIDAQIPQASVGRLAETKAASLELPNELGRFHPITDDEGGRLVFLGMQVDPVSRTVPLVYELINAEGVLRVGQAVTLYVETDRSEQALAIADSAIVEEDGRPIAFVQVSGETFEKRDLTLGIRDEPWVQVLEGVAEGERVVSDGAYSVRLASVSTTIPAHGHAH